MSEDDAQGNDLATKAVPPPEHREAPLLEHAEKWLRLAKDPRAGWGGMPSIPIGLVEQLIAALRAASHATDGSELIATIVYDKNTQRIEYQSASPAAHQTDHVAARTHLREWLKEDTASPAAHAERPDPPTAESLTLEQVRIAFWSVVNGRHATDSDYQESLVRPFWNAVEAKLRAALSERGNK